MFLTCSWVGFQLLHPDQDEHTQQVWPKQLGCSEALAFLGAVSFAGEAGWDFEPVLQLYIYHELHTTPGKCGQHPESKCLNTL